MKKETTDILNTSQTIPIKFYQEEPLTRNINNKKNLNEKNKELNMTLFKKSYILSKQIYMVSGVTQKNKRSYSMIKLFLE